MGWGRGSVQSTSVRYLRVKQAAGVAPNAVERRALVDDITFEVKTVPTAIYVQSEVAGMMGVGEVSEVDVAGGLFRLQSSTRTVTMGLG